MLLAISKPIVLLLSYADVNMEEVGRRNKES